MRRILLVAVLCLAASCSDDDPADTVDAAPDAPHLPLPGGDVDAASNGTPDGGAPTSTGALERPTDPLPRPPTDRLPADLIPPRN